MNRYPNKCSRNTYLNSVGIKRGDMWIGSIMMYFIDVQTRQMTSGMQCQDSQQNSRNNVLSMSRQGDPTARCLTTERTWKRPANAKPDHLVPTAQYHH